MYILNIFLLLMLLICSVFSVELVDLLGLGQDVHKRPKRQTSLRNSASKFLLEVYNDIAENDATMDQVHLPGSRQRRAVSDENFITEFDRMEIENCNNIITFASKNISIASDMQIGFNTSGVHRDLKLVYSSLRIYQQPSLGKYAQNTVTQNATITIYERMMNSKENAGDLKIRNSINTTTSYKGWLEFNITRVLNRWLNQKSYQSDYMNYVIVGVTLNVDNGDHEIKSAKVSASDLGLVKPDLTQEIRDLQPFIVGYFDGPELILKIQKMRFRRHAAARQPAKVQPIYKLPKTCDRLNFTVDIKDLHIRRLIIAPQRFEAYFCGGECNFPLVGKIDSTNHAIVQTLMHIKNPNLPKPCCVPTVMGSITLLGLLNDDDPDSYNLMRCPQSIVKECGCR